MNETFLDLLQSPGHWAFELFIMLLFDGVLGALLWPKLRKHWQHHLDRDRAAEQKPMETPAGLCSACGGVLIMFDGGDYCPGCGTFGGLSPETWGTACAPRAGEFRKIPAKNMV